MGKYWEQKGKIAHEDHARAFLNAPLYYFFPKMEGGSELRGVGGFDRDSTETYSDLTLEMQTELKQLMLDPGFFSFFFFLLFSFFLTLFLLFPFPFSSPPFFLSLFQKGVLV